MFQIGDNIVYPMQGTGIIESIEEKEFPEEKQQYYVIKMSNSNMKVMIPTCKILSSNIRPVTDLHALTHIIHIFQHGETDRLLPWKQRYKVNTEKIKTGEIQEGAEVVRDLLRMKKEKALTSGEKKMLDNAYKFLISELEVIKGITENQIKKFPLRLNMDNVFHSEKYPEFFNDTMIKINHFKNLQLPQLTFRTFTPLLFLQSNRFLLFRFPP